jgi:phage antirepressor YoqD-like protein
MSEIINFGDRRMTVREVAEALGVSPEAIKKWVRKMYPDLMRDGVTTYLNEFQVTAIKMAMTSQLASIVPTQNCVGSENGDLQQKLQVSSAPKTDLEKALLVQQALMIQQEQIADLQERNKKLQQQIQADQPKVNAWERALDTQGLLSMQDVSALLNERGMGRNNLFGLLRKRGIFSGRVPYRTYIERGYFQVKESVWEDDYGNSHVTQTAWATQKGFEWLVAQIAGTLEARP